MLLCKGKWNNKLFKKVEDRTVNSTSWVTPIIIDLEKYVVRKKIDKKKIFLYQIFVSKDHAVLEPG